jgi:hypothetical protein
MLGLRKSTAIPPSRLYAFMMFIGRETLRLPLRSLQPVYYALTGLKEAARKNGLLDQVKITSVERKNNHMQLTRLIIGT